MKRSQPQHTRVKKAPKIPPVNKTKRHLRGQDISKKAGKKKSRPRKKTAVTRPKICPACKNGGKGKMMRNKIRVCHMCGHPATR